MPDTREELEAKLASASTERDKIAALDALGWDLRLDDIERSLSLCQQAYDLARASVDRGDDNRDLVARSLASLANAHALSGGYDKALAKGMEAAVLAEKLDLTSDWYRALRAVGFAYLQIADYPSALSVYLEGLRKAESRNDFDDQALFNLRIGSVYSHSGDYRQALDYCDKCLALCLKTGNRHYESIVYDSYAIEYRALGDYDQARDYALKALALNRDLNQTLGTIAAMGNLGEAYTGLKQYDEALKVLQERLALAEKSDYPTQQARAHLSLGRLYHVTNRPGEAVEYFQFGLALAEKINLRDAVLEGHRGLAESLKALGQFEQAFNHLEAFQELKTELLGEETAARITALRVAHQTDAARKEAEFYRLQNESLEDLREQDLAYFERLSQMKNDVMSTASHNLKNPVSSILLYTDLLRQHVEGADDVREYLDMIVEQARRMQHVIASLLDLARLETGRALEKETLSINDFLGETVATFKVMARSRQIELAYVPSVPDTRLAFDPTQIGLALENLMSNAIKYTAPGGKIQISAGPAADAITIQVTDTGVGIPERDLPHLFERFYRVDNEQHRKVEGSGLGLAITRSIVEQHGGRIWVKSHPGAGSTFGFSLPLVEEESKQAELSG